MAGIYPGRSVKAYGRSKCRGLTEIRTQQSRYDEYAELHSYQFLHRLSDRLQRDRKMPARYSGFVINHVLSFIPLLMYSLCATSACSKSDAQSGGHDVWCHCHWCLSRTVDGCCRVLAVSVLESLCVTSKYNALVITVCFAANV